MQYKLTKIAFSMCYRKGGSTMLLNATSIQKGTLAVQGALQILMQLHITAFEYPHESCVLDGESYDYIIVGGGTAGCVLASRLVEDNKTKVLLIEAGANPQVESDLPALLFYGKSSYESWNYTAQDLGVSLKSHKPTNDDLVLGRGLGGTSSISYMLYSSGSKHDYNNWAKIVGDDTWNWENVLPYLKKSQRLEDQDLIKTDGKFFGQNGKIGMTVLKDVGTISSEPYFEAFKEEGYDIIHSMNGNISIGYTNPIYTISNGERQNTAITYLVPKHPNLRILENTLVIKVIFDAYKNAIGVVAIVHNKTYTMIKARKEVILSAGVVNTPKLLMLSGIGPEEELCKHNIRTISNLPVGEGLQDHVGIGIVFNMTKKVVPYRPFNPYKFPATTMVGYVALNKSEDYPDYESYTFVGFPVEFIKYCAFTYYYIDPICNNLFATSVNTQMIYSIITKQWSKSRGKVILQSNNFRDDPLIFSGYFKEKEDLVHFARIVQDYARIEETDALKRLGGKFMDPKLAGCGKYDKEDLEYWQCYVQYMMTSHHQYSSTCAMGSVVDSHLKVYGVNRLRVVDASVMPNPTVGGTLGSTIMIAEKAADMIKHDKHKYGKIKRYADHLK